MERGTKIAIEMLGKGLSQVEVSRILGCTESAISQVVTSYSEQISELAVTANAVTASLDEQMEQIEHLLVEKIRNAIPLETDVMKLARLFQTINGAKRRSKGEGATGNVTLDFRDYADTSDDDMAHAILTANCTTTTSGAEA